MDEDTAMERSGRAGSPHYISEIKDARKISISPEKAYEDRYQRWTAGARSSQVLSKNEIAKAEEVAVEARNHLRKGVSEDVWMSLLHSSIFQEFYKNTGFDDFSHGHASQTCIALSDLY
jgi:hypothetical protein